LNFDEDGNPKRGLRTFGEIAHYVRCIPFKAHEGAAAHDVWCTPDFLMTQKIGDEDDHAILMASVFRTVKHEGLADFTKWKAEEREKTRLRKDREAEMLALDKETRDEIDGEDEEDGEERPSTGKTKAIINKITEKETEKEAVSNVDDRVFLCLGKAAPDSDQKHVWVMTINKTFDEVTFWAPKAHKHYVLKHRIDANEGKYLQNYLCPDLTAADIQRIAEIREE
jgi:hypothetical protein